MFSKPEEMRATRLQAMQGEEEKLDAERLLYATAKVAQVQG